MRSMQPNMTIQAFSPVYEERIFDLIIPIQTEEFGIKITRQDQPDLAQIPDFYQKGNGNFWIAIVQKVVVGTIALLDIGHHRVALRKMFVHKDYRGKERGVAQTLLDEAQRWAESRGISDIFLGTTAKFLAAHRFYEKNGFVEIDKTALPTSFPIMAVDTKFYHRPISVRLRDEAVPFGAHSITKDTE